MNNEELEAELANIYNRIDEIRKELKKDKQWKAGDHFIHKGAEYMLLNPPKELEMDRWSYAAVHMDNKHLDDDGDYGIGSINLFKGNKEWLRV